MLIENYVSCNLPSFLPEQSLEIMIHVFDKQCAKQLPVVKNNQYLGLVSKDSILKFHHPDIMPGSEQFFVQEKQHIFDALRIMQENNLSLLPVLNDQLQYKGCITQSSLIECFAIMTNATDAGELVVLEMQRSDYSLTHIASIAEDNHSKVLGVFIHPVPDAVTIYVTLKVITDSLSALLLAYERYNYTVAYTFSDTRSIFNTHERYEGLMRFLTI